MFGIDPGIVIFLIPIVAILGGFTVAIVGIIMKSKDEELKRKERILAMEKGLPVPPEPPAKEECCRPAHVGARRGGLILTFVGIALVVSLTLSSEEGIRHGTWGIVVLAVGLALLVASAFEKRDYDSRSRQ